MEREISNDDGRTVIVREASPDDATELLSFARLVAGETQFLSFAPDEFDVTDDEERALLRQSRRSDNQLFLVAVMDESIVGSLHFSAGRRPRVRHSGEFGISVRRDYWGLGIGSRLISSMLDWAKRSQVVTKINLRVRTDNQRAIRLYERLGFEKEGTIRRDFLIDGTYYDAHWMGQEV